MPTYVFRCPNGHEVEVLMSIAEGEKPMPCVPCHEETGAVVEMTKAVGAPSVKVLGGTPTHFPGRKGK